MPPTPTRAPTGTPMPLHAAATLPLWQLLLCGAVVVTISMGIRHGFGFWLGPITMDRGWSRETYSLAMAIQNLVWGAAGPVVGWWADRKGALGALLMGAVLYAAGLLGMAMSTSVSGFMLCTGVLIGCAQACSTYAVIYGAIGRHVDASQRSWAMGVTAAAGSFGQFLMVPLASSLISHLGWQHALWVLAASALLIGAVGWGLHADKPGARAPGSTPGRAGSAGPDTTGPDGTRAALLEALGHPSYLLLTAGYFVCGFQLAFIGVHLPSYLKDHQLPPGTATTALALIGLFNVLGSFGVGWLGQRWRKPYILAGIYGLRAVAMTAFVILPPTPLSVTVFAAVMGALWLSTVPPTNAIVAQMLGVKHLSMLGALVFLSHQLGSFLGVWLAGRLYDLTGHYELVWHIAIGLGVAAALLNLPVREHEPPRGRRLLAT